MGLVRDLVFVIFDTYTKPKIAILSVSQDCICYTFNL